MREVDGTGDLEMQITDEKGGWWVKICPSGKGCV